MGRDELLQSIATTILDYRKGEIPAPTAEHVDRWIRQFDPSVQEPMLTEMDHVLKQSYLSREYFLNFLEGLAARKKLPGDGFWQILCRTLCRLFGVGKQGRGTERAHRTVWEDVTFLDIQKHGASQHAMLNLFQEVLGQEHQLTLSGSRSATGPFLYLDDILFTGNRIILDLRQWLQTDAPSRARLVVVVMACYNRGLLYTHKAILQEAAQARKTISLYWLRSMAFEDRPWSSGARDGFHPAHIPDHPLARACAEGLERAGYPPRLRVPNRGGESRLFSSEAGRHLLEQQLLLAGLNIQSFCRNPKEYLRPLGYHTLKGFGFGATVVTYRNCPNNCPLAWWWGDSSASSSSPLRRWYPLFPRKV